MSEKETDGELATQASINYENIKKSITGLLEVMKISLSDKEDSVYYNVALDNIEGLTANFIELILNERGLSLFLKKRGKSNLDIDAPLREKLEAKLKELKQRSTIRS